MQRIVTDPTQVICPNFGNPEWEFMRTSIIATHLGDPLTAEEAIQQITDAWTLENNNRIEAWNQQLEADRVQLAEEEQRAQDQENIQRAQLEKEANDQRKEIEKKKPKLNSFDPNRQVESWIAPRPSPFALNKINALEYIELDYFTVRGCNEAAADAHRSIDQDTLAFTQFEGAIAVRPLAAQRSSKNIRRDEDLSWEEMMEGKNLMLHFMAQSRVWPAVHAKSMAAFFVELDLHPQNRIPNGRKALILYQSQVRIEWFSALKRDEGFNIQIIREDLLRRCVDTVNDQARERQFEARMDKVRGFSSLQLYTR
jgi:hypothetical protein